MKEPSPARTAGVFAPEQANKLGLHGPGKPSEFDKQTCDWELGDHLLSVSLTKDRALNELNFSGDKAQPTTFKGHEAIRVDPGEDRCSRSFAATSTTSVTVYALVDVRPRLARPARWSRRLRPVVGATIFGN